MRGPPAYHPRRTGRRQNGQLPTGRPQTGQRRRRSALPAAATAVLVIAALAAACSPGSSKHRASPQRSARATHAPSTTTQAAPPKTPFPGPDGMESPAVIAENRLPGTKAWVISGAPATGSIEGFANTTYAAAGQDIVLYVSTTAASFHVVAYRMGWYGGAGARQIWESAQVAGRVQPPCPVTAGTNMVSCDNWAPSLSVAVTAAFVQGDYLFKLVGAGGEQSYVLMTIWDPASTATYLVMTRSLTEQGWNTFGGYSYYQGEGACAPTYPPCNRARVVSFDRPYAGTGYGSSDFLSNEYPLVRLMEKNGLDAAYVSDVTVDQHPGILANHRTLLSLGHDETWTYNEREAAVQAFQHGMNIVFFGAAAVLRHSRLQPSPLGSAQEEVDYRDSAEDPLDGKGNPMLVTGNTWSSPPSSWSEVPWIGQIYAGYTNPGVQAMPLKVTEPSAWIYRGTGLQAGSLVPGVILSDIDHLAPAGSFPSDIEVMAHSPLPLASVYTNQGKWAGYTYSDLTYYTDQTSKAGILDTGTVNWIPAIDPCVPGGKDCFSAAVVQMTLNILWVFGGGPAGVAHPSQPNWQAVTPAGS